MAVRKVEIRLTTSGFPEAHAELDKLSKKLDSISRRRISPRVEIKGIDKSIADIALLDVAMKKVGGTGSGGGGGSAAKMSTALKDVEKSSNSARSGVTSLGSNLGALGNYGMPILIGTLVAVAPELITAGLGLGAFGLAAVGAIQPLIKASKATGGLSANLNKLDPEQRAAAESLLRLEANYKKFEKALAPQVLQDWNRAMKLGGGLLKDFQPVAQASGVALDGVLSSLTKNFQGAEWQQFFGYLQKQAGPDIRQLGGLFTDLANQIPPLVQNLHPLASGFITVTDSVVQSLGPISAVIKSASDSNHAINSNAKSLDALTVSWTNHIPGMKTVNHWLDNVQHAFQSNTSAAGMNATATSGLGRQAQATAAQIATETAALGKQNTVLQTTLGTLNNYIDATITQANDLHSLKQALQTSGDKIGYKTQKERDSFAAAQTFIENTDKTAVAALSAHRGIDAQISTISRALPILESVKGKTAAYRAELETLKAILDKLRAEKNITDFVNIVVNGALPIGSISNSHGGFVNGGGGGHLMADGGPVRGPGTGQSDSVPARLSNGEYVVRAAAVHAVGMGLLDRINSAGGGNAKRGDGYHFASGGSVHIPGFLSSNTPALDLIAGSGTIKADIHALIKLVQQELAAGAIGQGTETWLTSRLRQDNGTLESLASKRRKIVNTINAAEAFRKNEKGSILAGFDITNVTNSAGGAPDAGDVMQQLKLNLGQVTQFANNIKKLGKMGLNKKLLRQIIQAGPVQGGPVAAALAEASKQSIKNINHEENQIVNEARRTSYIAADVLFDSGKQAGKGFLTGLKAQERNIEKEMRKIAQVMVRTIKRELHIKSPSQVMHDIGLNVGAGLALGMDHSSTSVNTSIGRLARGIPVAFGNAFGPAPGAHMSPGGGGGMQITIKGEGDDLVKAVVKALRYDIATNGGGNVQAYLGRSSR